MEEKWIKIISIVNALPEEDESFAKNAGIRPEYESNFKLKEIPKAIAKLVKLQGSNKARKAKEMALIEKAYNAAVDAYSRRLNDASLDLLAEQLRELSTKTETRGGFQHEAWKLAKDHSVTARTKSFQPRNASGINSLQINEKAKKGESPTVSGDKFRVLLADRYAAKQAARPGHPGPWLHLADAVDLAGPSQADLSTESSAEDGTRFPNPAQRLPPTKTPDLTDLEFQDLTDAAYLEAALDRLQNAFDDDTRSTFQTFDSQLDRVKMQMATGTDNFHAYFVRRGGTLGRKVYKYLLSRLYAAEQLDKSGLTWQIAMALKNPPAKLFRTW